MHQGNVLRGGVNCKTVWYLLDILHNFTQPFSGQPSADMTVYDPMEQRDRILSFGGSFTLLVWGRTLQNSSLVWKQNFIVITNYPCLALNIFFKQSVSLHTCFFRRKSQIPNVKIAMKQAQSNAACSRVTCDFSTPDINFIGDICDLTCPSPPPPPRSYMDLIGLTNEQGHHKPWDVAHWKKENQILLIYKEIQNGAVAKSYVTIMASSYIVKYCAFPHILGSPFSYMTLQLLHSEFPYIWGKFDFFFINLWA